MSTYLMWFYKYYVENLMDDELCSDAEYYQKAAAFGELWDAMRAQLSQEQVQACNRCMEEYTALLQREQQRLFEVGFQLGKAVAAR